MKNKLYSNYFYGNKASNYAIEHGYLDWGTFAKAFDAVMNNDIMSNTSDIGYWEPIISEVYWTDADGNEIDETDYYNDPDNCNECYADVYQWFIVSDAGAEIIKDYNVGVLYYNSTLDINLWGVTHWGTSWDYVLTDVKLNCGEDAINE